MGILDAAKRLAAKQDGGVAGLAARMNVNRNTLFHKLAGQAGHNLFAKEIELMTMLTGDPEIAQELALACGHVCIPVAASGASGEIGRDIAEVARDFGELMKATQEAIADRSVTQRELAEYDKSFAELVAGAVALRNDLKKRIPVPPDLKVAK